MMEPARHQDHASPGTARLHALAGLAGCTGATSVAREASEVAARVAEGRFYVACVGQFKRGKSTFLNALLGEPVLPTGVVPVTSAITVLRHGPRGARVSFQDGRTEEVALETLPAYVTERENPENRKGVRALEVFLPSALLARGMCLVDTPGLGSAFGGNAAVTREFVPHVDAAVVVVGADPPISGEEVALAAELATHARHLLVVLNKADRLTDDERREGALFAAQILSSRLRRPIGRVYEVSAQERITTGAATRDWADLASALEGLARAAGADLVEAAEARAFERLGRALLAEIAERRDALVRPLDESERRLSALERHVAAAERAIQDLGVLLVAEQAKLARTFRERQEAFLPRARDDAWDALSSRAAALAVGRGRLREAAFDLARAVAVDLAERFRAELEPEAERLYGEAMARFVALANEFLERVASDPAMDALPRMLGPESGFRARSELHYTGLLYTTTRTPLGWVADLLRTRRGAVRAAVRRAGGYLDDLVEANSSRIANDLVERAATSRARLEAEIRGRLREISHRARRALEEARHRREEGQRAVEDELSRLEALCTETESLLAARPKGDES
jgi:GTP-binding protein EngB required for normal cell division